MSGPALTNTGPQEGFFFWSINPGITGICSLLSVGFLQPFVRPTLAMSCSVREETNQFVSWKNAQYFERTIYRSNPLHSLQFIYSKPKWMQCVWTCLICECNVEYVRMWNTNLKRHLVWPQQYKDWLECQFAYRQENIQQILTSTTCWPTPESSQLETR